MKILNFLSRPALAGRTPAPLVLPVVGSVRVDLQYHRARTGGDFFDARAFDASRLVFLLLDVAGPRIGAMELAAFAQDEFRSRTPELFTGAINEAEALSELCMHLNRTILASAGRAHMTAAFLGVLSGGVGALTYINAGHVPGLLLTTNSSEFLESTGLPLGLFSHATHEAGFRVIPPDGALLLASRGIVEARSESGVIECIGHGREFGSEGLLKAASGVARVAQSLCRIVLDTAIVYAGRHIDNDMSVAAISRDA
jgi:serine phosphatase RsbU (regulator of sigma subunit)